MFSSELLKQHVFFPTNARKAQVYIVKLLKSIMMTHAITFRQLFRWKAIYESGLSIKINKADAAND